MGLRGAGASAPVACSPGTYSAGATASCIAASPGYYVAASASTVWLARTTVTVHSDSATTVDDTLPR